MSSGYASASACDQRRRRWPGRDLLPVMTCWGGLESVAASEFPRLIRRLAWETAPDAVRLGFPAGSGTSAGDWDGSVRTVTGNAFVPAGLSVWELSVEKSGMTAKADDDYGKRTSTPDGSPTSDAEYVEAILAPWTGRRGWAAGKRGDGRWKTCAVTAWTTSRSGWSPPLSRIPGSRNCSVSRLTGTGPRGMVAWLGPGDTVGVVTGTNLHILARPRLCRLP